MPRKKKEQPPQTLAQEANLPESWHTIESEPINPSAPSLPLPTSPMGNYFAGTTSPVMQHDGNFVKTAYGTRLVPIMPLMPVSLAGTPTAVASTQSVIAAVAAGPPGSQGLPGSSGTGNMTFRGQWNSATLYNVDDVVLDNISTYIAVAANTNQEPDSGSSTNVNWNLLGKNLNFRGQWLPSSAPSTVAYVQSARNTGGAGPLSQAFSNPNAAGNTIVVCAEANQNYVSGHGDPGYGIVITDTQGNVYSQVGNMAGNSNTTKWKDVAVFVAANCKAGANTVTLTTVGGNPPTANDTLLTIAEYVGNPSVYPLTFLAGVVQDTPPPSTITSMTVGVSTGQPNQMVVLFSGALFSSGGETPPAGFATRQLAFYDKVIAAALTVSYTTTYSGNTTIGLLFGLALTNVGGVNYVPFDTVIYRGSTYVCVKATTGAQVPTNTIYWVLLSQGTGGVNALANNYSIIAGDDGQLISNSTSSNYTATLLAPPPYLGWWVAFQNSGSGTLIVDPNGLTLDGSASTFTLNQNQGMLVFTDGANYLTERGIGTITSLPSIFNVSAQGAATLVNEVANSVFAGPTSGPAAPPTFRAIVAADLPAAVASFNRKVISTTTYSTISSDVGKALDVQTSSATTITLRATPLAPTFVGSYGWNRLTGNQTTGTLTGVTLTTGNLAVITVECYRITTDTITVADSNGNVWHKVPNTFVTNNHNPGDPDFGSFTQQIWYSNITVGGAGVTITATFPITVNYPALYGCEATSADTVDQANNGTGNGVPSSGNITTTSANEFIYGSVYDDSGGSSSAGTGWTLIQTHFSQYLNEYRIPVATGTFSAGSNQAGTVQYTAAIASFAASPITPFSGFIQNNGTAVVTVTPSSGLINGQSSINLFPGQGITVATDGTNFTAVTWTPATIAAIDLTAQAANIGATNMFTTIATGRYSVSSYVVETTAGSISSTLPNVQIVYTDPDTNAAITIDATPILAGAGLGQTGALNANTIGTTASGVIAISAKTATNIQYQTVNYASNAAGMQYALHLVLQKL
jgi:hypothetical protein